MVIIEVCDFLYGNEILLMKCKWNLILIYFLIIFGILWRFLDIIGKFENGLSIIKNIC